MIRVLFALVLFVAMTPWAGATGYGVRFVSPFQTTFLVRSYYPVVGSYNFAAPVYNYAVPTYATPAYVPQYQEQQPVTCGMAYAAPAVAAYATPAAYVQGYNSVAPSYSGVVGVQHYGGYLSGGFRAATIYGASVSRQVFVRSVPARGVVVHVAPVRTIHRHR